MATFPRRSARLSQQYTQDNNQFRHNLPSFSAASSTSTTSHPSPVSDISTIASQEQEQIRLQMHSQFLAPQSHFHAPLPSPSVNEGDSHFARLQSQSFFAMSQHQQSNGQQSQQQLSYNGSGQHQQQQTLHHHNSFSQPQRPSNVQNNHQQSTSGQLPPDFLAEAARRAQMACLMRDLGDVAL